MDPDSVEFLEHHQLDSWWPNMITRIFNLACKMIVSECYPAKREQRTYRTWIFKHKVANISFRDLHSQTLICYLKVSSIINKTIETKQIKMDILNYSTSAQLLHHQSLVKNSHNETLLSLRPWPVVCYRGIAPAILQYFYSIPAII